MFLAQIFHGNDGFASGPRIAWVTTIAAFRLRGKQLDQCKSDWWTIRKGKETSVGSPSSHRSFENAWISMLFNSQHSSGYSDGPGRTTLVIDYRTMVRLR
ncbi:hypothetical protein VNO77_03341 [Canavalia gladiata]|uniref:Uncharacterized protein n=1 Tax=Canavalia gladiata TaxID=3824 RepID=A0AAN9MVB8_CANGL